MSDVMNEDESAVFAGMNTLVPESSLRIGTLGLWSIYQFGTEAYCFVIDPEMLSDENKNDNYVFVEKLSLAQAILLFRESIGK